MNNVIFGIAVAGYVLAVILLIAAIIVFFKFNIVYVVKDLKGTIAQQEIMELRKKTSSEKNKRVRMYDPDKMSGKMTKNKKGGFPSQENFQNGNVPVSNTEMKTSVLQFNKVVNPDFVIVTDIVYVNTEEKI